MSQSYTYSLDGESGVTLNRLERELQKLNINEEAEIRRFLPTPEPSARNTVNRLRTTLYGAWREAELDGSVNIHASSLENDIYIATVHINGEDENGDTLSAQRYAVKIEFKNGVSDSISIHSVHNGSQKGCEAIGTAIREAEESLPSTAWSHAWNRMHSIIRSVRMTKMNFLCFNESQVSMCDSFVAVAQACGVRAYRHDQPQFVAAEQMRIMIEAELAEAESRLDGNGRVTALVAQSRLEAISYLSEMLISTKSLLGGLSDRLETSVENLREQWLSVEQTGVRKTRAITEMIALTPQGREWMQTMAESPADAYTLVATQRARENLPTLLAHRGHVDPSTEAMISAVETLCARLVRFDPSDREMILQLQSEGFISEDVLEPIDSYYAYEALEPLLDAPKPKSEINYKHVPSEYLTTMTRTFEE